MYLLIYLPCWAPSVPNPKHKSFFTVLFTVTWSSGSCFLASGSLDLVRYIASSATESLKYGNVLICVCVSCTREMSAQCSCQCETKRNHPQKPRNNKKRRGFEFRANMIPSSLANHPRPRCLSQVLVSSHLCTPLRCKAGGCSSALQCFLGMVKHVETTTPCCSLIHIQSMEIPGHIFWGYSLKLRP